MKKRLQIALTDEAWTAVENVINQANQDFEAGHINFSDVINEMVLNSKVDIKTLQDRHTDLRRSLRAFAKRDDLDLDTLIKSLTDLKRINGKGRIKSSIAEALL